MGETKTMLRIATVSLLGVVLTATALPAQLLQEGFEDVDLLEGRGWSFLNVSAPLGASDWFQGNNAVFSAQAGVTDSYLAADYQSVAGTGTISNWAMTPVVPLTAGDELVFWTRTRNSPTSYPDRLEVRLSTEGARADLADGAFDTGPTVLRLDINPAQLSNGYPAVWTQYVASVPALSKPGEMGRFVFRYFVVDAGPTGDNADYIGIDSVSYDSDGVFFDDFESGDATAWPAVQVPLLASGTAQVLEHQDSFDFLTAAIGNVTGGDFYLLISPSYCDGGPSAWANNFDQGPSRFLSDLPSPLSSFTAPASGYSSGAVCLHEGGVYVFDLDSPAGYVAFVRVTNVTGTSVTIDYQVR
jgi:hypothetical protein